MQKIYLTGVGEIELGQGWKTITKPENFRCSAKVLSVINRIRSQGDRLVQSRGRQVMIDGVWQAVPGNAKLFVVPADENRVEYLSRIRQWMALNSSDSRWCADDREADVRLLVIVHRMAARRLGFLDLFEAFNDGTPESLKANFAEGTAWALRPFLDVLLPLCMAWVKSRSFDVLSLLRRHCPKLEKESLVSVDDFAESLQRAEGKCARACRPDV